MGYIYQNCYHQEFVNLSLILSPASALFLSKLSFLCVQEIEDKWYYLFSAHWKKLNIYSKYGFFTLITNPVYKCFG